MMRTRNMQRLHDVLAAQVVFIVMGWVTYGVYRLAGRGDWHQLAMALAYAALVALVWVRSAVGGRAWRNGYREAVDDFQGRDEGAPSVASVTPHRRR